jgi:hypothetical protein
MNVAPLEIFSLLDGLGYSELTIFTMLLSEVSAVRAIFMIVPYVIVAPIEIVVSLIVMIVGPQSGWRDLRIHPGHPDSLFQISFANGKVPPPIRGTGGAKRMDDSHKFDEIVSI